MLAHMYLYIYVEILISNSSVLNCEEDDPVGIEVPKMLFKELKLTLDTWDYKEKRKD